MARIDSRQQVNLLSTEGFAHAAVSDTSERQLSGVELTFLGCNPRVCDGAEARIGTFGHSCRSHQVRTPQCSFPNEDIGKPKQQSPSDYRGIADKSPAR